MNYLFPIAFAWNTFAMTALMVILGISGQSHLAADVGIIQAAIAALFLSFSANSRSIILNPLSQISIESITWTRLVLLLPLALAAYLLCTISSDASVYFAIALILRRCVEWISDIHLSKMELENHKAFARNFICLQIVGFLIAVVWLFYSFPVPSLGLYIWALSPLLLSVRFVYGTLQSETSFQYLWNLMLPQFGSTMIIGITLYVFRLIILVIAGKEIAGILFTSFALGGMIGSLFAQVLGPSVVLYEDVNRKSFFTFRINLLLGFTVILGMVLFVFSQSPELYNISLVYLKRSNLLWSSIGASLVGGVVMVYAQMIRFRILQLYDDFNLFGPDLLMNILIIACIPYTYYILGINALTVLYLISSILAYIFYWCAERQDVRTNNQSRFESDKAFKMIVAALILLPVFVQFNSGIFNDSTMVFDSLGRLSNLPIPISAFACFIFIPLISRYRHAYLSLSFLFTMYIVMLIASFVSSGMNVERMSAKLIFLLQFILPMAALVLGQLYGNLIGNQETMYRVFLYVIMAIIPLQLISTWIQGTYFLYPKIFLFSIYQHLQYVPLVLVSAFLMAMYALWKEKRFRTILLIYIPIVGIYATMSVSIATISLFYLGITLLVIYYKQYSDKLIIISIAIALTLTFTYLYYGKNNNGYLSIGGYIVSAAFHRGDLQDLNQPINISTSNVPLIDKLNNTKTYQRSEYWRYHLKKIMSGIKPFLFGSAQRPNRNEMSSAHNYYLDLIYNYGFISFIPLIFLIGYTVRQMFRQRHHLLASPDCLGLYSVVMYLVLVDNFVKVGLRQPYSGIFTFFIWGILLSKMVLKKDESKIVNEVLRNIKC
jgi:hypothetical protein